MAGRGRREALAAHPALQDYLSDVFASGVVNIPNNGLTGGHGHGHALGYREAPAGTGWLKEAAPGALFSNELGFDGEKLCYGVQVVWALEDMPASAAVVLLPGSHRSTLAPYIYMITAHPRQRETV